MTDAARQPVARTPRPVRLVRFGPTRPWFHPGTPATVEVELTIERPMSVRLVIELLELDRSIAQVERAARMPVGRSIRRLSLPLPAVGRRGYGLHVRVLDRAGRPLASGDAAVEALDGWWQSPRHAAVTRFTGPAATATAVRALREWHVTVVQDYDWMYRHYRYAPPARDRLPGNAFLDALGRRVSHAAVRAGIRAGHKVGIATLAYGSVYGAEREYMDRHPDERVFDDSGEPLSLGGVFFINDLRPDRPWRRRLLAEYAAAVREFGFDGIHMDSYGPPHRAVGIDGGLIDFASEYPGLIADGAAAVAAARTGARVLFNCVEGFPLEAVGDAPAAAIYLELWPPDERYGDLVAWIERARAAGDGRAIVIAAYLSCLRTHEHDPEARAGAVEAVVLLTSVIAAAGAYHHVLAEARRVLVEGYYPEARPLRTSEAAELCAAWSFGARYVHTLSDPGATPESIEGIELSDNEGMPLVISAEPAASVVWARATRLPDGRRVLNLVDLRDQPDDRWDRLRAPIRNRRRWRLVWPGAHAVVAVVAASPWTDRGRPTVLRLAGDGATILPPVRRWLLLVEMPPGDEPDRV